MSHKSADGRAVNPLHRTHREPHARWDSGAGGLHPCTLQCTPKRGDLFPGEEERGIKEGGWGRREERELRERGKYRARLTGREKTQVAEKRRARSPGGWLGTLGVLSGPWWWPDFDLSENDRKRGEKKT